MATELLITFPEESLNEAGSNVVDLKEHLAMVAPTVETEQRRTDASAQDMGATLAILLGAPAAVALAKGIADWLVMRASKPKLVIRNREGQTILELDNMPSGDVRALLEGKIGAAVGQ
jgi:hypothetical protein